MAATSAQQELALFRLARRLLGNGAIRDFSGGLNLQAAPSELGQNETPDCMDITLDERGGVIKRTGLSKVADVNPGGAGALTGTPLILYYSRALDKLLMQVGTSLYKSDDGGTTWAAAIKVFSTSARVGMCDFLSKVVVIHPVDGAFTYDGTTFSAKVTNSPNGNTIAAWQNALFSAGDPSNPTRVTRSDIGAITWPAGPTTTDFRVKDDTAITALIPAGVNALLVFKEESSYRVQDVTTIAYMMLSPTYGASGPMTVALNQGLCAALSRRGISITDGMSNPRLVSSRIEPLFRSDQLAFSTSADWCAGVFRDRFVFSLARTGGAANDTTLEYNPQLGWIVPHSFGMNGLASYTPSTRKLLGAKVAADAKTATFEVYKGGTDDGGAISCHYQTPWLEPAGGYQLRLEHIRAKGRGNFTIAVRTDYADAGVDYQFRQVNAGMLWGTGLWGSGLYGGNLYESFTDFRPWKIAKAISFYISQSSSSSVTAPKLLGRASSEVGDFACYGLEFTYAQAELP